MSSTAIRPLQAPTDATVPRRAWSRWLYAVQRWHLLSLDAPTVAAVWLMAFLPHIPLRIVVPQAAALAAAVWLLYAGDRLLDAARQDGSVLEARHRFHARYQWQFLAIAAVVLPMLVWLLLRLPAQTRAAWLLLSAPMALYALAVHRWAVRRLPKEMMVALMFAAAVVLPAMLSTSTGRSRTLVLAALFGGLCWLNCVAIARWEHAAMHSGSSSTAWAARRLRPLLGIIAGMGAVIAVWVPLAFTCALSAGLLLLLDRPRTGLDPVARRALADASLLTPLLFLLPHR